MTRPLGRLFGRGSRYPDVHLGKYSRVSKDTEIGAHSYVGRSCEITRARIGRYVSIGNNVSVGNGEHDLRRVSTSSLFYADPYAELTRGDCVLESDVWVGVDAIVRRNVHVGFGAVIGANSFVNKDVPAFAIVAGSPARLVSYRFAPERQARILASKWWQEEPDVARQLIAELEAEDG